MDVAIKSVREMTRQEFKVCFMLNTGKQGMMRKLLGDFYCRPRVDDQAHVVIIKNGDLIVAWSLVFKSRSEEMFIGHYYTRRGHRRRGYGSQLIAAVHNRFGTVIVYPNTKVGDFFFDKHEELVELC